MSFSLPQAGRNSAIFKSGVQVHSQKQMLLLLERTGKGFISSVDFPRPASLLSLCPWSVTYAHPRIIYFPLFGGWGGEGCLFVWLFLLFCLFVFKELLFPVRKLELYHYIKKKNKKKMGGGKGRKKRTKFCACRSQNNICFRPFTNYFHITNLFRLLPVFISKSR